MEKILVALDGSTQAARVLAKAAELAQRLGARLVLYHAVGIPRELPRQALLMTPDETAELLLRLEREALEKAAGQIPRELVQALDVTLDTPWRGVCEAARRHRVQLVVVGGHGYGGLDRLLGTTAARIVNHADVSVLVVRDDPPGR